MRPSKKIKTIAATRATAKDIERLRSVVKPSDADQKPVGYRYEQTDGWASTERAGVAQWMPHDYRPVIGFAPNVN